MYYMREGMTMLEPCSCLVALSSRVVRWGAVAALLLLGVCAQAQEKPYNVLFLMSDDLNTNISPYGDPIAKTPNMDKLFDQGVRFDRAYCSATTCIPSRTAILTGQRPQTTGVYGPKPEENIYYTQRFPDLVTLPMLFKDNGYRVIQIGKISDTRNDDPAMWSESYKKNLRFHENYNELPTRNGAQIQKRVDENSWFYAYWAEVEVDNEELLGDGAMATEACEMIKELAKNPDKPFFLGVGFKSPHVDFSAPQAYYDLYRDVDFDFKHDYDSKIKPRQDWYIGYENLFENTDAFISSEFRPGAMRAYYACTSFVDAQVGKVLQALQDAGLAENTIIVFAGDHGFLVGGHAHFGKSSFFEPVWRTPMAMVVPGVTQPGSSTEGMIEFVDIYPTLAELCDLKAPDSVEGRSFVSLLKQPDQAWKDAVFSVNNAGMEFVRTDRWKLVLTPKGQPMALFDELNDPDEKTNLVNDPQYKALVASLKARIDELHPEPKNS